MEASRLKNIAYKIGIYGSVATVIYINAVPYVFNHNLRKTNHYQQAIKMLHSHPEAKKYLGEPIVEKNVRITKIENYGTDGTTTWITVPVVGSLSKGQLYYDFYNETVQKSNSDAPSLLSKVELMVDSHKDYKLIIKKPD